IRDIIPDVARPILTYGFDEHCDFRAINVQQDKMQSEFDVVRPGHDKPLHIRLNIPGIHNVLNAVAVIAVATDEGLSGAASRDRLASFQRVGRRFQVYGDFPTGGGDAVPVDDYGHHPREVAAIIKAVRDGWPERRLVMVYQPHRYTRTRDLYGDLVEVLSTVDALVMLEVYSAGEEPTPGADSRHLCRSIRARGVIEPIFVESVEGVPAIIKELVKAGDIVITQGAGNVGVLSPELARRKLQ